MRFRSLSSAGARQIRRLAGAVLLCLPLAACLSAPEVPLAGADPADPAAPAPATRYRSVVSGYVALRPVAPLPWREQNERVAPTEKR